MWRIVVAVALTGCNSLLGIHEIPGDGRAGDGSGSVDGGHTCFGSGAFTICLTSLPTVESSLASTIDTSSNGSSSACMDNYDTPPNHPWCLIDGTTVTIIATNTVQATGPRPLVLLATGDLTISGTLDASSHLPAGQSGALVGPGANMACPSGDGHTTMTGDTGGGAGAGGSFGTAGGMGGAGGDSTATGGIAIGASATPDALRGGCSGGLGAPGMSSLSTDPCQGRPSQPAGDGGGAVYLIADGTLRIDGVVAANGAGGGQGLFARGGGSGGGSGGMIALWSAGAIAGAGIVMASGGGGGGGADHCASASTPGSDPSLTTIGAAPGGPGGGNAPTGGSGGAVTSPGGNGTTGGSKGGSAGGGGVGFILEHGSSSFPGQTSGVIAMFAP